MNFDGLRAGGVELIFKKLPISRVWGSPGPNSRARGHHGTMRSGAADHPPDDGLHAAGDVFVEERGSDLHIKMVFEHNIFGFHLI